MSVHDRGVLITGAGSGIGRALAVALNAAGARLVLTDISAESLAGVAEETGAATVPGDLRDPDFPGQLVRSATEELGAIDYCFSNAGVDDGMGPEASEDIWDKSLEVNLRAHIRLARALLPGWLERNQGHLVITASAAGLLTMVGNAPYSVSKHAAVAFAEWLAIEHGPRGITVQALCPQGVNTRMLDEAGPARELLGADGALEPADVAATVIEALADKRFLILPHPEVGKYYRARATDTDRWLVGMQQLRERVFGDDQS